MEFMFRSDAGSQYTDERLANIDCYMRLGVAIIEQAVLDYVHSYRVNDKVEVKNLERFFKSDEFMLFSGGEIDPRAVLRALRRKALRR